MKSAGQILEGISLVWWPTILRSLSEGQEIVGGGKQTPTQGYKLPEQLSNSVE
jgi:hypothetical protein